MKKVLCIMGTVVAACICILILFDLTSKMAAKKGEDFEIIDTTEVCAEALEGIYSDNVYDYFLPCIKSQNITIKFNNGTEVSLKEAINSKMVTIKGLQEKGLVVYKELRIK